MDARILITTCFHTHCYQTLGSDEGQMELAKYLEENAEEAEEEGMVNIPPLPDDPVERQAVLRELAARSYLDNRHTLP